MSFTNATKLLIKILKNGYKHLLSVPTIMPKYGKWINSLNPLSELMRLVKFFPTEKKEIKSLAQMK